MNDDTLSSSLSEPERRILMGRVYNLLSRQTARYLAGDSTAIPVEIAEEPLRQGQHILQGKLTATRGLWERACLSTPQIPNACLQDTLKSINGFFKHYDLRYFAHQLPCAIDYPRCIPASETLQGVSYTEQWLRHLLIENWIISRFQPKTVFRLLSKVADDYWEYPINMCEQPLLNALSSAMLRRAALSPGLSNDDLDGIEDLLCQCTDVGAELERAVIFAAAELRAPEKAGDYMKGVLSMRCHASARHGIMAV